MTIPLHTGLRLFMKALDEPSTEATQFEQKYRELITAAYPKQADGSTIFNFKRFFFTATKPMLDVENTRS
ncbi:hypothetical protein DVH05_022332 [Phytophthora capsici]|nr:hypothetical protein DVH05_022332 [Phytophthora capsici]